MHISPVSSASVYPARYLTPVAKRPSVEASRKTESSHAPASADKVKAKLSPEKPASTAKPEGPGVLRLLEEGHFQGVADVRLRINFAEELATRATERQMAQASEGTDALLEETGTHLDDLTGSLTLTEEQSKAVAAAKEELSAGISEAMADFQKAESPDVAGLRTAYQKAFDTFLEGVKGALQPAETPPESTDTQPPATDAANAHEDSADTAAAAPAYDLDTALADLVSAFGASLDKLMTSLESVTAMPAPAPYEGAGKAYAKFLAIYDQMRGLGPDSAADQEPTLDLVA